MEHGRKDIALANAHRKKGNGPSVPSPTDIRRATPDQKEKDAQRPRTRRPRKSNAEATKATVFTLRLNGPTTVEEKVGTNENGKAVANGTVTNGTVTIGKAAANG